MTNKLYVEVTFSYFESKSGYKSIKTSIRIQGKKRGDASKKVELKLKPAKPLDINKFQLLAAMYGNEKLINGFPQLKYSHVQARLYKGSNYYGEYKLLKVFLNKYVVLSVFLDDTEKTIIEDFMDLEVTYSENTKEVIEFEDCIAE
jgi:hypothetical protein